MNFKILSIFLMVNYAVSIEPVDSLIVRNAKRSCSKIEYYDRLRQRCRDFPGGGYLVIVDHSAKCANGDRGLHKFNRNDFYYVCHPEGVMIGMCPTDMVFSEIEKKCVQKNENSTPTIRIYDESKDCGVVIPNCNSAGIFSVPSNCSYYYDCQQFNYDYHQYVYKCPHQTMFHPDLHRCTTMTRCYPDHYDIFDRFDYDYFPRCVLPGQFRTSKDCSLYYRCIPNMDGSFFQIRYECPPTMFYDRETERCEMRQSDKCEYIIWDDIINDYASKHNMSNNIDHLQNTTVISTINTTIATSSPPTRVIETTEQATMTDESIATLSTPININQISSETNVQDDTSSTIQYSDLTIFTDLYQTNETTDENRFDLSRVASTSAVTTQSEDITLVSTLETDPSTTNTALPALQTTDEQTFLAESSQSFTDTVSTVAPESSTETTEDNVEEPTRMPSTFLTNQTQLTTSKPPMQTTVVASSSTTLSDSDGYEHFTWDDEHWSRRPHSRTTAEPRVQYHPEQQSFEETDSDYWDDGKEHKFPGTVIYSTIDVTTDAEVSTPNVTTSSPGESTRQTTNSGISTTERKGVCPTELSTTDCDTSSDPELPTDDKRTPGHTFPLDSDELTSPNKEEPVVCFNNDAGGLTCDGIRGKRGGSFVIPGYIIRYRQRKNEGLASKPGLDAKINLRLSYPTSYLIEAIARQRSS
ncbi:uncharacterized protein LOC129770666 [Toxorhynchites rutilus septentrionalis]|uniref:uncharacterized protein LOC129770666 n=1 Tax=Toxorhynchites rutilus septentrionalis TaxID=329112 RepID=UPI0024796B69|nr:uncharacterized protein LOC129770666 [Toxorhynchites rutilus septentrionalis]